MLRGPGALAALAGAMATAFSGVAYADCVINSPAALVCVTPEPAAIVYQKFGNDPSRIAPDYVRALLQQAGCTNMPAITGLPIPPLHSNRTGRIARPTGWVDVTELLVPDKRLGATAVWIASDYLTGECISDLHKPPVAG